MCFKQFLICVYYLFVNITRFDLYSVTLFCCFYGEIGENPQGKSIFPVCVCAVRVWLTCVFATKTMAVRIFQSGKTLGEYFSQLCTCFAWGATDSDKVSFSIDSCENYVVPRGVQQNPFSKHLLHAHPTAYIE